MPIYVFKCERKGCGHRFEEVRRIADRNKKLACPKCGAKMARSFLDESPHTHQDYRTPVYSDAMGCHPAQVAEHRKTFPDVPITNDGRVIVRNHHEHRRIMKRLGFTDRAGYH